MISLGRWGRWNFKLKSREDASRNDAARGASTLARAPGSAPLRNQIMPRPALRWIAQGRVALRAFDYDADVEAVLGFQPETYGLNFPDFVYSPGFAQAFRHDLRRASLDAHNALFVLDDGASQNNLVGFLWLVICQNNWTGERYGYVNNVFVVAGRRGGGLGIELMRQADEWFRSRGVRRVRLSVTASNAAARALYEKNGFHVQRLEMEKDL